MAETTRLDQVLEPIAAWARPRPDILGLAVVGSWARGAAGPDSDIDLMLLVPDPEAFRSDRLWPVEIPWGKGRVTGWHDAQYGIAWSRHVKLEPPCEIEFTFCDPSWATTNPVDRGTVNVVSEGCLVVLDRVQLFQELLAVIHHD
jgi:uncharacterized protein